MKISKIGMILVVALLGSAAIPANLTNNTVEGATETMPMVTTTVCSDLYGGCADLVGTTFPAESNCEGYPSCEAMDRARIVERQSDFARSRLAPFNGETGGYGWGEPVDANESTDWIMIQLGTTMWVNTGGKPFAVRYETAPNSGVWGYAHHYYEFRQNVVTGQWAWEYSFQSNNGQRMQLVADWDETTFYTIMVVQDEAARQTCSPGCG